MQMLLDHSARVKFTELQPDDKVSLKLIYLFYPNIIYYLFLYIDIISILNIYLLFSKLMANDSLIFNQINKELYLILIIVWINFK